MECCIRNVNISTNDTESGLAKNRIFEFCAKVYMQMYIQSVITEAAMYYVAVNGIFANHI